MNRCATAYLRPTDRAIAFSLGQRERAEAALRAGMNAES